MKHSRRQFLFHSAAATAISLCRPISSQALTPFLLDENPNPLRLPTQYGGGDVTVEEARTPVWPGALSTRIMLNSAPLLAFEFERGSIARIPFVNKYTSPISIHWHGLDVPALMDGHPKDAFSVGTTREYSFPVLNRAGMYFFHSHSHMATAREVHMGLAGLVLVRDEEERALGLPSGEFELPVMIQDVRADALGQVFYSPTMNDMMNGWMGNRVLVNGTPNTIHTVKRGTYRLRLVNGSNARLYKLQLSNNQTFTIIGTDGGLLAEPITVSNVLLAPAERLDILVDFTEAAPGSSIRLVSAPFSAPVEMMSPVYPQGLALDIINFVVSTESAPRYTAPSVLSSIPALPDIPMQTRSFTLAMSRGMGMGMRPTINGKTYDLDRVDFEAESGSYEIWEFRNQEAGMFHPMHIHGRQFYVISRSGGTLLPTDKGLKDTILVNPQETVRLAVRHSDYDGLFLFHCHNLEHEDEGMMQNYLLKKPTGIQESEQAQLVVSPNPANRSFRIHSNVSPIARIDVIDVHGNLVKHFVDVLPNSELPISDIPAGSYTLRIGNSTETLIVHR